MQSNTYMQQYTYITLYIMFMYNLYPFAQDKFWCKQLTYIAKATTCLAFLTPFWFQTIALE